MSQGYSAVPTHCTPLNHPVVWLQLAWEQMNPLEYLLSMVGAPRVKPHSEVPRQITTWVDLLCWAQEVTVLKRDHGPPPSTTMCKTEAVASSGRSLINGAASCTVPCIETQTACLYVKDLFEQSEPVSGEIWAPRRLSPYCRCVRLTEIHSQIAAKIDFFCFSTSLCPTELTLLACIL